jgi:hypothetical protein
MNASNTNLIIAGIVFLILLVFYIIAKVKSKKYELILTANGWDMAMLLACPVAIFVAWCWGFDQPLNTAQIVCLVIAGLCLAGTIIMSIVHNSGSFMDIVISILAKLFIVWLTLMAIFLLIVALVVSVMITLMRGHNEGEEYILLKYDHALRAYVGYRI